MIEKPKRPKQLNIHDRQPPRTLQELINRYDLDNTNIYDYLDKLVNQIDDIEDNIATNESVKIFKTQDRIVFRPSAGSSQDSFGGCYYYKIGTKVHLHVGCNSLTSNTLNSIFTLPEGYRPDSFLVAVGAVAGLNNICFLQVSSSGDVSIKPTNGAVALADIEFDAVQ